MIHALVYKSEWIPASETFIRDQLDHLMVTEVSTLGLLRVPSANSRTDDVVLYRNRRSATAARLILSYLGFSPRLTRYIQRLNPDLVHIHFATEGRGIPAILRRMGIPYVVTCHGNDVTGPAALAGLKGFLVRRQTRKVLADASVVIAVSTFCAQMAAQSGADPASLVTLPTGTKVVPHVSAPKEFDVVFVGRLVPVKGVDHLLRAVNLIDNDRAHPLRVLIVGDGPHRDEYEQLAMRLKVSASFLGNIEPGSVPHNLSRGRVFVGPSTATADGIREGFGMVFLEAGLQELPVVAYDSGGVSEAVVNGVTGVLVPDGDVTELARAIRSLLDDAPRARQMGRAARERVVADFDITSQTRKLEELYARAVGA